MSAVTIPEITIEGDAASSPVSESDWWCEGFMAGFNGRELAPPLVSEVLVASYFAGTAAGKEARDRVEADFDARFRDQPALVPDLRGEAYDEVEKRYREAWEAVFHDHMPHTDVEGEPGPPPVRPNITLVVP